MGEPTVTIALTDAVPFTVNPNDPELPVRISTYDGRNCTLVAHRDGTYSIGMLHRYCTTT